MKPSPTVIPTALHPLGLQHLDSAWSQLSSATIALAKASEELATAYMICNKAWNKIVATREYLNRAGHPDLAMEADAISVAVNVLLVHISSRRGL